MAAPAATHPALQAPGQSELQNEKEMSGALTTEEKGNRETPKDITESDNSLEEDEHAVPHPPPYPARYARFYVGQNLENLCTIEQAMRLAEFIHKDPAVIAALAADAATEREADAVNSPAAT